MNRSLLALTAGMLLMGSAAAQAQTQSPNLNDDTQMLLSQIQADKAAVVLKSLELTDPEARAFTPIYDEYQKERKEIAQRQIAELNKFASNYGSMTDKAAGEILKSWFKIQEDKNDLVEKYAKKFDHVLPKTKVLRFVQVENKLETVVDLQAARVIPLAK
jgi:Spy/CpxP family protein refolding chaperone